MIPQFVVVILEGLVANKTLLVGLEILTFAISTIAMIWSAKKLNIATFKLDWITKKNIIWIVLMFVVARIVAVIFTVLNGEISANVAMLQSISINKIVLFVMAVIVAPICEETIFRGYILGRLFKNHMIIGLFVSSFLFSCIHSSTTILSFLIYMVLGAIIAVPYIKSKRLETSMATHFLNNLLPGLFLLLY